MSNAINELANDLKVPSAALWAWGIGYQVFGFAYFYFNYLNRFY